MMRFLLSGIMLACAVTEETDEYLSLVQTRAETIDAGASSLLENRAFSQHTENNNEQIDRTLERKGETPSPTPSPTPYPTPYPTPSPTPFPTPSPTPSPTPAPTTTTTTTTAATVVFELGGTVAQNNLGGIGPDSGSAELRFSSVANVDGVGAVDLVVTSDSYESSDAFKAKFNGNKNGLGRIGQAAGESYDYTFTVENANGPVTLGSFVVSFFDVDANAAQDIKETVTVCGATGIMLTSTSRLAAAADGGCTTVAPAMLTAADNVASLTGLTEVQKDHAFSARFDQTSSFTVRTVISPAKKKNKVENRALMFSGAALEGAELPSLEEQPPPPTCDEVSAASFAGKTFEITQKSTYGWSDTYTYTIEIGGEINQETSSGRVYKIGEHQSYGDKTESFGNGERCGSTPRRATVTYTFGSDLQLISASETTMCVYEFEVQLPETDCAVVR